MNINRSGIIVLLSLFTSLSLFAQKRSNKPSKIHLSIFPGFSNVGVKEIEQDYNLSLNLTSGVTSSVHGIEIGVISNYNFEKFQGIQLAGFANISGANNIINPKEKLEQTFKGLRFGLGLSNKRK